MHSSGFAPSLITGMEPRSCQRQQQVLKRPLLLKRACLTRWVDSMCTERISSPSPRHFVHRRTSPYNYYELVTAWRIRPVWLGEGRDQLDQCGRPPVPNENATSLYVLICKCAGGRFESPRWRSPGCAVGGQCTVLRPWGPANEPIACAATPFFVPDSRLWLVGVSFAR